MVINETLTKCCFPFPGWASDSIPGSLTLKVLIPLPDQKQIQLVLGGGLAQMFGKALRRT